MAQTKYEALDALICSTLPATYGELCRKKAITQQARETSPRALFERLIDSRLQHLKRSGRIRLTGERRGRAPIWEVVR